MSENTIRTACWSVIGAVALMTSFALGSEWQKRKTEDQLRKVIADDLSTLDYNLRALQRNMGIRVPISLTRSDNVSFDGYVHFRLEHEQPDVLRDITAQDDGL